ncbi:hypothetical protein [Sphingobacterium faecale]|uniref:Uncharacterized protein n=1 Tax=Sphingobacterium faecale TaxID=2803775 RepID=A0ABS1QYK5_9SPHI|nr:hypothetical protein [Sphingobacterium faecale]MBL1407518.1 hypothetical protein [Sphingobacterium faecale]
MATLKNNWSRISFVLTGLVLGLFIMVNGMDDKKKHIIKKENTSTLQTPLYWFQVDGTYNLTSPVAIADASSLSPTPSTTPPQGAGCDVDKPHQCVSGFSEDQVDLITMKLKTNSEVPKQTPRTKN